MCSLPVVESRITPPERLAIWNAVVKLDRLGARVARRGRPTSAVSGGNQRDALAHGRVSSSPVCRGSGCACRTRNRGRPCCRGLRLPVGRSAASAGRCRRARPAGRSNWRIGRRHGRVCGAVLDGVIGCGGIDDGHQSSVKLLPARATRQSEAGRSHNQTSRHVSLPRGPARLPARLKEMFEARPRRRRHQFGLRSLLGRCGQIPKQGNQFRLA